MYHFIATNLGISDTAPEMMENDPVARGVNDLVYRMLHALSDPEPIGRNVQARVIYCLNPKTLELNGHYQRITQTTFLLIYILLYINIMFVVILRLGYRRI